MDLSKALKAKLSYILSGVASLLMLGLNPWWWKRKPPPLWAFVWPPVVETACMRVGPVGGPSQCVCVWFVRSFECSLSWWRKVGLPFFLWRES